MPTTKVNQVPYDFQSLQTELVARGGQSFGIVDGLEEFDYKVTINRTEIYGAGRLPMQRPTEGDAEFDASITVHRYWFNTMVANARALGMPLADLEFILHFTYSAKDEPLHTDTLVGVMLKEIGNSGSHGPDPLVVSKPLRVGNIFFDGVDIFGNTL